MKTSSFGSVSNVPHQAASKACWVPLSSKPTLPRRGGLPVHFRRLPPLHTDTLPSDRALAGPWLGSQGAGGLGSTGMRHPREADPPPPHNAVGFSGAMRHGCWGSHLSLPLVCFHVTGMATSPKAHKHSDGSTLLTPPRPRQFAAKEAFQMAVFWGILCGIVTRSRNCPRNKRV